MDMSENDKIVEMPSAKAIDETAAIWVMRLDNGGLDAAQQAQLAAWLSESERHAVAFNRLAGLWGRLDSLSILTDFKVANERAETTARTRPSTWWMAIAATLLVVGLSIAFWRTGLPVPNSQTVAVRADVYSTRVGEMRTIALADGTRINLNTHSVMEVSYSENARRVYLRTGEAHFDVTKDAHRPFTVRTSRGQITAVGTAFSVRILRAELEVLVAEGMVSLRPVDEPDKGASTGDIAAPAPVMVAAGQNAVYDGATGVINRVSPAAIESKLSWRSGMLYFSGEPLGDVLQDVGRYTNLVIEIEDPDLADLPVSGRLKIGEVDAMLEALEIMADTTVQHVAPGRVLLQKNG